MSDVVFTETNTDVSRDPSSRSRKRAVPLSPHRLKLIKHRPTPPARRRAPPSVPVGPAKRKRLPASVVRSPTSPIRSPTGNTTSTLSYRDAPGASVLDDGWSARERIGVEIQYLEARVERLKDALRDLGSGDVRQFVVGCQFRTRFESTPRTGSGIAVQTFEVGSTDGARTAYLYERVLRAQGDRLDPHYLMVTDGVACDRVFVSAHAALLVDSVRRAAVALPANFCGARFTFMGNVPTPVTRVGERRGDLWFGNDRDLFVVLSDPMTVVQVFVKDLPPEWSEADCDTARHDALVGYVHANRATLVQPACTIHTHYKRGSRTGSPS